MLSNRFNKFAFKTLLSTTVRIFVVMLDIKAIKNTIDSQLGSVQQKVHNSFFLGHIKESSLKADRVCRQLPRGGDHINGSQRRRPHLKT